MLLRRCLVVAVALIASATAALAHDPGLSSVVISVEQSTIDARATFNPRDLEALDAKPEEIAKDVLRLRTGNQPLRLESQKIETDSAQNVEFILRFVSATANHSLHIESGIIGLLPNGHRQMISVKSATAQNLAERLISAKEMSFDVDLASALPPSSPSHGRFAEFFLLGVEHILTGYDHLLFLTGILIMCSGFGAATRVITCFTIAHSLTLALAAFNVLAIPSHIVEPMIAASIVYVGVENLWSRGKLRWREILTFSFGLVHGLGFASVLREMGIGTSAAGVAIPLFSFNAGVEAGQLAIAAIFLPMILKLRSSERFPRIAVPAISLIIACAGAYWFCQRVTA